MIPQSIGRTALRPKEALRGLCHQARRIVLSDGVRAYVLTTLVVLFGVYFAINFATSPKGRTPPPGESPVRAFVRWDGLWYERIATGGYQYDPGRQSSVAFFPLYPTLGRLVSVSTGLPVDFSLLVVSHVCLAGCFVVLGAYARHRFPNAPPAFVPLTLLGFGLFPATFFFRMAYSESLFTLLLLVACYGMVRGWADGWVAVVIGLATATRPVGVALIVPFGLHVWAHRRSVPAAVGRFGVWLPVCCVGLLTYMGYQYLLFGYPFAFAQTQVHWRVTGQVSWDEWLTQLLSFEPVWGYFVYSSPFHWSVIPPYQLTISGGAVLDRLTFLTAAALVATGWRFGWLTPPELALTASLVGMAYLTRGCEMGFVSMGRFTAVAFPIYLVLGGVLTRLPATITGGLLAGSGAYTAGCAALHAARHFLL